MKKAAKHCALCTFHLLACSWIPTSFQWEILKELSEGLNKGFKIILKLSAFNGMYLIQPVTNLLHHVPASQTLWFLWWSNLGPLEWFLLSYTSHPCIKKNNTCSLRIIEHYKKQWNQSSVNVDNSGSVSLCTTTCNLFFFLLLCNFYFLNV